MAGTITHTESGSKPIYTGEDGWRLFHSGRGEGLRAGYHVGLTHRDKIERYVFESNMVSVGHIVGELVRMMKAAMVPVHKIIMRLGEVGVHELIAVVDAAHFYKDEAEPAYGKLWDYVDKAETDTLHLSLQFLPVLNIADVNEDALVADGYVYEYNLGAVNDPSTH